MKLTKTNEMCIRIKIREEFQRFIKEGTSIEYMEDEPKIFYDSKEVGKSVDAIMAYIKFV